LEHQELSFGGTDKFRKEIEHTTIESRNDSKKCKMFQGMMEVCVLLNSSLLLKIKGAGNLMATVGSIEVDALEALPVDDGGARLIVFLLRNPHLLEGGERGQDGTSDPDRVFPFRGSNDLDLHGGRSQGSDLLLHAVSNARVHGGATRQDSVGIKVLPDVNITLHDGVVGSLMDTTRFHTQERGLEKSFGTTEPLIANGDDLSIRQLIGLLQGAGAGGGGHFLLKVKSNIAELLLDVTDNFAFSSSGERVTALR
jgi:hypothetical protein